VKSGMGSLRQELKVPLAARTLDLGDSSVQIDGHGETETVNHLVE